MLSTVIWDIKLFLLNFFFILDDLIVNVCTFILDCINPFTFKGSSLINWKTSFFLPQNLSIFFGIKFCLCISFLILIRGGTPRYRYDYLTKLGWLKFLSLIILIFAFSLLFFLSF